MAEIDWEARYKELREATRKWIFTEWRFKHLSRYGSTWMQEEWIEAEQALRALALKGKKGSEAAKLRRIGFANHEQAALAMGWSTTARPMLDGQFDPLWVRGKPDANEWRKRTVQREELEARHFKKLRAATEERQVDRERRKRRERAGAKPRKKKRARGKSKNRTRGFE